MIKYILRQVKNQKSTVYGKWIAYPVIEETIDLDGLAAHMASHNTVFSKGIIKGLLTDMVSCIKELLLEGKNVKLPDLAIFSIGVKNSKGGANTEEEFSVTKNIQTVKLRARATGELTRKSLDLEATLKKATALTKVSGSASGSGSGSNANDNPNDNSGGDTGSGTGGTGGNTGGGTSSGGDDNPDGLE